MEWNWNKVRMEQKCGGHYISTDYACFFFFNWYTTRISNFWGWQGRGSWLFKYSLKTTNAKI